MLAVSSLGMLAAMVWLAWEFPNWPTDVGVYRDGAEAFLRGDSMYTELPPPEWGDPIPYIYPPVSVLLFVPLALVPVSIGFPALTLLTTIALVPIVQAYRRCSPEVQSAMRSAPLVLLGALAMLSGHPVQNTIFWGQINVLLMLLVVLDILWPNPRWPRGLLIGIAAAIKLTPAGFALIFLLRKDWRALGVSLLAFAGATTVGAIVMPSASVQFWGDRIFTTTDLYTGTPYANEAYAVSLEKLGMTGMPLELAHYGGLAAIAVMTVLGTKRAVDDGNLPLALGVTAAGVLLVSPVSWSHHWVLALPTAALILIMGLRRRNPWLVACGALAVVVFWTAPHYWLPLDPARWTVPEMIAGSSYQLLALALLIVMTLRQLSARLVRTRSA